MKRIAWLSDIHLNFVRKIDRLVDEVRDAEVELLLIGGDIAEAGSFAGHLSDLADRLQRPIYFVLGNHDYYGGSIDEVRGIARQLSDMSPHLFWLPSTAPVKLTDTTTLVGHGGWGDARLGGFLSSPVRLNDYKLIADLQSEANDAALMEKLNALGDEAARSLEEQLSRVPADASEVIVLAHVPPFREACVHEGKISNDGWLPHFSCHAVGELLERTASKRADCRFKVHCGHTHSRGECEILPNLAVYTAGAEYGLPKVEQVLQVG